MTTSTTGIKLLNWETIKKHSDEFGIKEDIIHLPEKVIQFGTGILLYIIMAIIMPDPLPS